MNVYYSKYSNKCFHVLLDNVAQYLKKYYNANIIESNSNHSLINYEGIEYVISDCELLIQLEEKNRFVGISFSDYQSNMTNFFLHRNNDNDLFLSAQYVATVLYNREDQFNFKRKNFIYLPSDPYFCLDDFYVKRNLKTDFIDKFIFRGNVTEGSRNVAYLLKDSEYFEGFEYLGLDSYYEEIINYKVGLCLPGTGELCYRDIEYMALGIPMMKIEYITQINPSLIPNYHYISINRRILEEHYNYNGGLVAVEREMGNFFFEDYINKFLEIKDNSNFLESISKNARSYYETYLHPLKRLNYVISLLELEK